MTKHEIESIKLVENDRLEKFKVDGKSVLPNISKVNIFVGANNSGRSLFLRSLLSSPKLIYKPKVGFPEIERLNACLSELDNFHIKDGQFEKLLNLRELVCEQLFFRSKIDEEYLKKSKLTTRRV